MSLVAGLLWPGLFSSKLSKHKAAEKYSGSTTGILPRSVLSDPPVSASTKLIRHLLVAVRYVSRTLPLFFLLGSVLLIPVYLINYSSTQNRMAAPSARRQPGRLNGDTHFSSLPNLCSKLESAGVLVITPGLFWVGRCSPLPS